MNSALKTLEHDTIQTEVIKQINVKKIYKFFKDVYGWLNPKS